MQHTLLNVHVLTMVLKSGTRDNGMMIYVIGIPIYHVSCISVRSIFSMLFRRDVVPVHSVHRKHDADFLSSARALWDLISGLDERNTP